MTHHPFRFAVITSNAPHGRTWRARARQAEALGYSTRFMPDHFQDQWVPIVGLTIAVEATERLNVGALVFDNDYRHPVVLAKELGTIDELCETLEQRRERYGFSCWVVPDEAMEPLAPVVARLAGK